MSQNLESERKGEKFTLIEPPVLPERPAKPNRLAIIIVSAVLSLLMALGSVRLAEALDDKIYSRKALVEIMQVPPLATVPVIDDRSADLASKKLLGILVIIGFLIICGIAIHTSYKPLDVLWFVVLRKLGF